MFVEVGRGTVSLSHCSSRSLGRGVVYDRRNMDRGESRRGDFASEGGTGIVGFTGFKIDFVEELRIMGGLWGRPRVGKVAILDERHGLRCISEFVVVVVVGEVYNK